MAIRIKELNDGGAFQLTDQLGVDRVSPDETFKVTGQMVATAVLDQFAASDKSKQIDKNLAQLIAIADIDSNAPENSGKFYDLFDGTNTFSAGIVDESATTLASSATALDTTIDVADGSVFIVGDEITIQDATNIERVVISNIATNTLTVTALTNSYASGVDVYRSIVGSDGALNFIAKVDDPLDSIIAEDLSEAGNMVDIAYSGDGNYVCGVTSASPYFHVWSISGGVYTKLANPSSLPTNSGVQVASNYDGTQFIVAISSSPFVEFFKRVGTTLTKITNPAAAFSATVTQVAINTAGDYAVAGGNLSPIAAFYSRSGDTWTQMSAPASLPNGAMGCGISGDGVYANFFNQDAYPNAFWPYKRTGSSWALLTKPNPMAEQALKGIMSRDGTLTFCNLNTGTTRVGIYSRSGDTWTQVASPTTGSVGTWDISLSEDNKYLAVALSSSPYLWTFDVAGDGSLTKRSDPSATPQAFHTYGISIRLNGENTALCHASADTDIYKASEIKFTTVDQRYDITPLQASTQILAWIQRNIISGYSLTAYISIVDSADPESFVVMDKNTITITGGEEDVFEKVVTTAGDKITLRIVMAKALAADAAVIDQILGAID